MRLSSESVPVSGFGTHRPRTAHDLWVRPWLQAGRPMPPRARPSPATAAELNDLAPALDKITLSLPQGCPPAHIVDAMEALRLACTRATAACSAPALLLRLPTDALLRVLRCCGSRDFAALNATCLHFHAGTPSLVERGAQDAALYHYGDALCKLPPSGNWLGPRGDGDVWPLRRSKVGGLYYAVLAR